MTPIDGIGQLQLAIFHAWLRRSVQCGGAGVGGARQWRQVAHGAVVAAAGLHALVDSADGKAHVERTTLRTSKRIAHHRHVHHRAFGNQVSWCTQAIVADVARHLL